MDPEVVGAEEWFQAAPETNLHPELGFARRRAEPIAQQFGDGRVREAFAVGEGAALRATAWVGPRSRASSNRSRSSASRRLLPSPASPLTSRTPPVPRSTCSRRSTASPSSRSRPTTGTSTPSRPRTFPRTDRLAMSGLAWTGSCLPLRSSTSGSPNSNRGSTSPAGRLADQRRAARRRGLDPCRGVDGVAHRGELGLTADRAEHDGSRVHTHARGERLDSPCVGDLVAVGRHVADDVERGTQRAFRVVLVGGRCAEQREYPVARHVDHGAVVGLGRRDHPRHGLVHEDLELLGIQLLAERGRAGEIGEQRGHHALFVDGCESRLWADEYRPRRRPVAPEAPMWSRGAPSSSVSCWSMAS